jgi:hypothetical protein
VILQIIINLYILELYILPYLINFKIIIQHQQNPNLLPGEEMLPLNPVIRKNLNFFVAELIMMVDDIYMKKMTRYYYNCITFFINIRYLIYKNDHVYH